MLSRAGKVEIRGAQKPGAKGEWVNSVLILEVTNSGQKGGVTDCTVHVA